MATLVWNCKCHLDRKRSLYQFDDIIKMLRILIDNMFVVYAGKVFQQTVGIPMGTNCAPLFANTVLYSVLYSFNSFNSILYSFNYVFIQAEFIQFVLSTGKIQ